MEARDPTAPLPVFPFLVGCPRSGTTLLQAMLASHPAIAVPPESHSIPRLARRFRSGWHGNAKAGRFADTVSAGRRFELWGITREELVAMVEERSPDDVAGAIRLLYADWAARAGKPRYADKTPAICDPDLRDRGTVRGGAVRAPDPRRSRRCPVAGGELRARPANSSTGGPVLVASGSEPAASRDGRSVRTGIWSCATRRSSPSPRSTLREVSAGSST